jgi:hypothetical protein
MTVVKSVGLSWLKNFTNQRVYLLLASENIIHHVYLFFPSKSIASDRYTKSNLVSTFSLCLLFFLFATR